MYNVGRYLDDYFKSFVNQKLNFKKHIQLILVDDGSTDNSAQIIKKWQEKYPDNITYFWKENGGQASARNIGLKHVKTDWVTFIDSDDFVSPDYFQLVDEQVYADSSIKLVCCNQIYYFEESNSYIDRHPLNYRFKNEKNIVPAKDLGAFMQFSAPLSFFHVRSIPKYLSFDEMLKPTFEDGKFVAQYLLSLNKANVCFYSKPKYFNRKREDKSSTMDNAWLNKGQFGIVLEQGYVKILKEYKDTLKKIPVFMQRTILWELLRLVKHLVDKEHNVSFLSTDEKKNFLSLMDETFSYIDDDVILSFELGSCGFSRQVGMLGCFKKVKPPKQVVYIDKYDDVKKEILVRYFTCENTEEEFYIGDEEVLPVYVKESRRYFLGRVFLVERRLWLPVSNGRLSIKLDGENVNINYFGDRVGNNFYLDLNSIRSNKKTEGVWVFMDRDDSARDNAEFFYEFVKNQDSVRCYFVLGEKTQDWNRLKSKGFNLISHGSSQHKDILECCDLLITSQIGGIVNPFENIDVHYKTVFLQHGVTKDDISSWINNCNIDLMITASKAEHESIISDESRYIYGEKEVKLTGFPRFDSLFHNNITDNKQILILFTWRKSISGNFINNTSSERHFNSDFIKSEYYKKINSLISSDKLLNYAKKNDLSIIFCPHPNVRPYIGLFTCGDNIAVSKSDDSIHDLISSSSMLITDYSSVAFDFAYMNKPVCYYQFDEKEFFAGAHTYTQGYFDYRKDGFGPVVQDEALLLSYIEKNVRDGFAMEQLYSDRVNEIFIYNDDNNCKRVYEVIEQFVNEESSPNNLNIISKMAEKSFDNQYWNNSANRWKKIIDTTNYQNKEYAILKRVKSLRENGDLDRAVEEFSDYFNKIPHPGSCIQNIEKSNILSCYGRWQDAIAIWPEDDYKFDDSRSFIVYSLSLFHHNELKLINKYLSHPSIMNDTVLSVVLKSLQESLLGNNDFGITALEELISNSEHSVVIECRLELVLANLFIRNERFDDAQIMLECYEKHSNLDPYRRGVIIELSIHKKQWVKVIKQIDSLSSDLHRVSNIFVSAYLKAKRVINDKEDSLRVSEYLIKNGKCDDLILAEHIENLIENDKFEMAEFFLNHNNYNKKMLYRLAYVLRMQGKLDEALNIISARDAIEPTLFDDWIIKAEILELNEKWDVAAKCWVDIMRKYPQLVRDNYMNNFYNSQIIARLN